MNKSQFHRGILFFLSTTFLLIVVSCASPPPEKPVVAKAHSDVETDKALGALPKKGHTEAGKQVQELEAQGEPLDVIQEMHRREKEEEQNRLHRSVTEDRIVQQRT